MNVGPTATKKNVLEQLLEQGMVLVALDARISGVDVPAHLGKDPQLRLNLSYRFGLPMSVDEWGVAATLTFAGVPFNCRFPWTAIFLMVSHVSGQPYLFPDDIPAELLSQSPDMATDVQLSMPAVIKAQQPERPKLTLVPTADAVAAAPPAAPQAPPAVEKVEEDIQPQAAEPPPASEPAEEQEEGTPSPRRPRRRGHLRLVK